MKIWLYILILLSPLVVLISVNEFVRFSQNETNFQRRGVITMNTTRKTRNKCSWACHNNTAYCKTNHVKFSQPYFKYIDPIYFGIIKGLKSTGDYGLANIIFLVILCPLFIYVFLIWSINLQFKINNLKKK